MIIRAYRFSCTAAAVAITCTTALGTSVDVSVLSAGSNTVSVGPGDAVPYDIEAILGDQLNQGLAFVLFDLSFEGGDLTQAMEPMDEPMTAFVRPDGITNAAGYGGTVINGDLIQVCGAQNTINNDIGHAPFPIGTVILNVGFDPVILVSGSLTAPVTEGTYVLGLSNLTATVIRTGEDGAILWATDVATAGTIGNLTVQVVITAGCQDDADCDDGDVCTVDTCIDPPDGTCENTYQAQVYGDIVPVFDCPTCAPQPDLDDILCIIDGFLANPNWQAACPECDIKGQSDPICEPDGVCTLDDILAVLDAFSGGPPCPDPCP